MGSIITAVAVLEIHMERKAVANIKPKIIFLTSVPIILIIFKAILLCKRHFSMANAKINHPIYKKTYLCPKEDEVSDNDKAPVSGKRIIGSNEVAAIVIASVIHQIAIQSVDAKTAFAWSVSPSKTKTYLTKENITGPRTKPIFF